MNNTPIKARLRELNIKMIAFLLMITVIFGNGFLTPLSEGLSVEGKTHHVSNVEFLHDLTYQKDGQTIHEQAIFNKVSGLIEQAEKFIIVDMFLFNDEYDGKYEYPAISANLTQALIDKKKANPDIHITFITDEVNTCYGAYSSSYLEEMKKSDINVVLTDLNKLRNSNPVYSGFWNTFYRWFDTDGKGWIPSPFSPDSPKVTLRAYLKLLNFKANHRKVLATEKEALISSANPHDASGYHSNIAFAVKGEIINDLVESERAVAKLSGQVIPDLETIVFAQGDETSDNIEVTLLTEGKIRKSIVEAIQKTSTGDTIQIGMFYLADRKIIRELIAAAKDRDVNVRLICDANKDAFGREKNGIPNRQVAAELFKKTGGKIKVKWYSTHGEQFHTKLIMIKRKNESEIFGGSANLTRRNIGDYNLETDLKITAANDREIVKSVSSYFERIWNNKDGDYTVDFDKYYEKSFLKAILYRFQEWSGLATF